MKLCKKKRTVWSEPVVVDEDVIDSLSVLKAVALMADREDDGTGQVNIWRLSNLSPQ